MSVKPCFSFYVAAVDDFLASWGQPETSPAEQQMLREYRAAERPTLDAARGVYSFRTHTAGDVE